MSEKCTKAILVVSFGTSFPETRKRNITAIENDISAAFPDSVLYSAWTSKMIMKKLLRTENKKINKQDMVVPADLELNVTELHKFLFNEEDYYPSPTVLKINEKIISDTGVTAKSTE